MNHYDPLHAHERAALALAAVVSTLALMSAVLLIFDIEANDQWAAGVGSQAVIVQAATPACAPGDDSAAEGCAARNPHRP